MRTIAYLVIVLYGWIHPFSVDQPVRKFLELTRLDTAVARYGRHIVVKQVLPARNEGLISNNLDDRDLIGRSRYTRDQQIVLLGEYLSFRGDTAVSNKKYEFKPASHMIRPEGVVGFTVQIEALFSFSRMLTVGIPPVRPVLIDRASGAELNTDSRAVNKVYAIYQKW